MMKVDNQPDGNSFSSFPDSAEAWVARLHAPDTELEEFEAFEQWLRSDPANREAYTEVRRLHEAAASLASDPMIRAAGLMARRRSAQQTKHRRLINRFAPLAAAAVVVAFGIHLWPTAEQPTEHRYAGVTGLPQTMQLSDGTQMVLDADSVVTTQFSKQRRSVKLERGRAEFAVAQASPPFEVTAGANTIRDIGTTFQVSNRSDGVTVGVLSGKVAVTRDGKSAAAHTLTQDQQIHIDASGNTGGVTPLDLTAAQGWTHGELVFRQQPLAELLEEMNRYSDTKVRLGTADLGRLTVSGTFKVGDQQALVETLKTGWSLRAVNTANHELTLYSRQ